LKLLEFQIIARLLGASHSNHTCYGVYAPAAGRLLNTEAPRSPAVAGFAPEAHTSASLQKAAGNALAKHFQSQGNESLDGYGKI
jgi:hypothetical protein